MKQKNRDKKLEITKFDTVDRDGNLVSAEADNYMQAKQKRAERWNEFKRHKKDERYYDDE